MLSLGRHLASRERAGRWPLYPADTPTANDRSRPNREHSAPRYLDVRASPIPSVAKVS